MLLELKMRLLVRPPLQKRTRRGGPEWQAVHRAGQRQNTALRRAFLGTVRSARSEVDPKQAAAWLERSDAGMTVAALLDWDALRAEMENALYPEILGTVDAGARAMRPYFMRQTGIVVKQAGPKAVLRFDLRNPRAVRWAAQRAADLVTNITTQTQVALRDIITRAQRRGVDVRAQSEAIAGRLRDDLGLTRPQIRAIQNYEDRLVQDGVSETRIATLLDGRRERMLSHRSLTIAVNETNTAANEGVQELWMQARDQGFLDPAKTQREWITQPGLNEQNPCPICRPMNGQRRGLEEEFVSPYDGSRAMRPGIHVSCLCTVGLVFNE